MTRHSRFPPCLAAAVAIVLTFGLWLPGARAAGRERPARRTARSGWSARSVGSAVWAVPDQELGATTPGAGGGRDDAADDVSQHDAPPGLLVTPPGLGPALDSTQLYTAEPRLSPRLIALGPLRGRAPPAFLA